MSIEGTINQIIGIISGILIIYGMLRLREWWMDRQYNRRYKKNSNKNI